MVVLAANAVFAMAASDGWFNYDAIAGVKSVNARADCDHFTSRLMSQNLRVDGRNLADAPVLIPMHIAAANADRPNPQADFAVCGIGRLGHFAFFQNAGS